MSLNSLAARAVDDLQSSVSALDVDLALDQALSKRRRSPLVRPALAVATVAIVALLVLFISGGPMESSQPPPPAGQPRSASIGAGLPGPAAMRLPAGWDVSHDGRYVELAPQDGSDARLVISIPYEVYEPSASKRVPLEDDLILWLLQHPAIESSERYGLYQYGDQKAKGMRPWTGNAMDLSLKSGADDQKSVPIIPLAGIGRGAPLSVTGQDATFRFSEVNLEGSRPIVFVATSSIADDQETLDALSELIQSIHYSHTHRT